MQAESVRGILRGDKTMTRRVVSKHNSILGVPVPWESIRLNEVWCDNGYFHAPFRTDDMDDCVVRIYPRVQVGDEFWVRESWAKPEPGVLSRDHDGSPIYKADYPPFTETGFGPWKSALFMPRWASRITLTVTSVKAERVQSISEEDAKREGASCCIWHHVPGTDSDEDINLSSTAINPVHPSHCKGHFGISYRNGYANLWDSINGAKHPWSCNPPVWAYGVEVKE
jgi:hypothetical protein